MGPPKGRRVKNFVKSRGRGGTGDGGEDFKMDEQLAALGLKVVPVTGDGNCFFRAIADQLEGNEEEHAKYRCMVVDYLKDHKEDFEPFLEEEVTFDEYCTNMRQDGTWAGHMELQATSLVTKCDICIHRVMFPRWQILNFQSPGTPVLQLSYHGEEHYNSVRKIDDAGVGPPTLETIKVDANLFNDLPPAKDGDKHAMKGQRVNKKDMAALKLVMAGVGSVDPVHAKQVLDEVHGDAAAAIEFLIAERNHSEDSDSSTELISADMRTSDPAVSTLRTADGQEIDACQLEVETEPSPLNADRVMYGSPNGLELRNTVSRAKNALLHPAQAVSRNKRCPCGSKVKYKACCGAVHAKAGVTLLSSAQAGALSNRSRREKSRAAKSSSQVKPEESLYSNGNDLGVLCI